MKRVIAVLVFIALGSMVFALGAREGMTEEEAIAKIEEKVAALQLTLEEAEAAEQAFQAMVATRARIRNALDIVIDALDEGLRAQDMNELTIQLRARINEELSAGQSEDAARDMVQERIRLRTQDGTGEPVGTATQTKTQTQTKAQTQTATGTPGKNN
jgi:hypothetical protein